SVVCDAEHLWHTRTGKDRESGRTGRVTNTVGLITNLTKGIHRNHTIDIADAFDAPDAALPIPPYTLGAWLGDGYSSSATICSA
ncbi:replicative DNA helicase, partial [Listeria monocytogenes]|uniref:hypothetical protein n=1 Tax=Listeria monocytogenes TaxID=1639 RepID=UPI000D8BC45D